jgi:hypothetical protein
MRVGIMPGLDSIAASDQAGFRLERNGPRLGAAHCDGQESPGSCYKITLQNASSKGDPLMKFLLALAAAALSTSAALAAEPVGVAACDEFLAKYEACVSTKVPAAQQTSFKGMVDQMRSSWTTLAKAPEAKPQLEAACKGAIEQVKPMLQPHGCTF